MHKPAESASCRSDTSSYVWTQATPHLTLPSVTACNVLISSTIVFLSGVESRYPMACRTKLWTACARPPSVQSSMPAGKHTAYQAPSVNRRQQGRRTTDRFLCWQQTDVTHQPIEAILINFVRQQQGNPVGHGLLPHINNPFSRKKQLRRAKRLPSPTQGCRTVDSAQRFTCLSCPRRLDSNTTCSLSSFQSCARKQTSNTALQHFVVLGTSSASLFCFSRFSSPSRASWTRPYAATTKQP